MNLAIFDFDGTITRDDSMICFVVHTHGIFKAVLATILVSPVIVLYVVKILPNWMAKEIVFKFLYKGWSSQRFNQLAEEFSKKGLNKIVKQSALNKISWHKNEGHKVVVVSASIENYLAAWCTNHNIELLGTRLEVKDGRITGKIQGINCHGQEKVRRIKEKYNLKDYECVYAYGDTKGDLALKSIAQEFFYRVFK